MLINLNFIKAEEFILEQAAEYTKEETGQEHFCSNPNCMHDVIRPFLRNYFYDFWYNQLKFQGYNIRPELSDNNPLYLIKESKISIEHCLWRKIIAFNNIKFKDLQTPILVKADMPEGHQLLTKNDSSLVLEIENILVFSQPYQIKGVTGVMLLPVVTASDNEGDNGRLPLFPILVTEKDNSLAFLHYSYEKDELDELSDEMLNTFDSVLSKYFTAIALKKIAHFDDMKQQVYSRALFDEQLQKLQEAINEDPTNLPKHILDNITEHLLDELNIPNELKEEFRNIANSVSHLESESNEDDEYQGITEEQEYLMVQEGYLNNIFSTALIEEYAEMVDEHNSEKQVQQRKQVFKQLLPDLKNKKNHIKLVLDVDNHEEAGEVHGDDDAFALLMNYEWKALADHYNVSVGDLPKLLLFTSDILKEYCDETTRTPFLHSIIKPYKLNGSKGFIFNVAFDNVILKEFESIDSIFTREMNNFFFFGVNKKDGYSLWSLDTNLENPVQINESGKDSNLNQYIGAQLCAIINYLNTLEYLDDEECYFYVNHITGYSLKEV